MFRTSIICLLSLAYGTSCVVPSLLFNQKKGLAGQEVMIYELNETSLVFSLPPLAGEQETTDSEDDSSEEDKDFGYLPHFESFLKKNVVSVIQHNPLLLQGSRQVPYSPPEHVLS
ncbi:MAG: hypothetical protein SH819_12000 [Cytophagales bacterium]|nr:hypothetical protein [Cytophagales bacterium]